MSILDQVAPSPKKIMTLFYLIDTSESMAGEKINTVNQALQESQELLKEVSHGNDDAEIKVAMMQFSSGCSWLTPQGPILFSEWKWERLMTGGITDLGVAFLELNRKLSKDEFLESQTGAYAPVILLLSDGYPTDNWKLGLKTLQENNWYKHAIKIAINIDSAADIDVLSAFTGSQNAILEADDTVALRNVIQRLTIRASEFQSKSKRISDVSSTPIEDAEKIVQEVKKELPIIKKPIIAQKPIVPLKPVIPQIGYKDFVVRRGTFKCMNHNHTTENVDAMLTVMPKNRTSVETQIIKIPAGYCRNCNTYFIMESTYERLCSWAIPLCRVSDEKTYLKGGSYNGKMQLAQESLLMQYGYTVSQTENLSADTRCQILAFLVDNNIMSKNDILSYLDFFVSQRRSQPKYRTAISRWESDARFIRGYNSGTYRQVWVNGIRR